MKLYTCQKCGQTYTHDKEDGPHGKAKPYTHAVFLCPAIKKAKKEGA